MSLSSARNNPDELAEPESDDLDPVTVEKRIIELVNTLSDALVEWKRCYGAWKASEREFDKEYAMARIAVDSGVPYNDRKYHADIATMDAREAKEVAEAAFKYSEKRLDGVRSALSAWQSVNRSVQSAYLNAGRGLP